MTPHVILAGGSFVNANQLLKMHSWAEIINR